LLTALAYLLVFSKEVWRSAATASSTVGPGEARPPNGFCCVMASKKQFVGPVYLIYLDHWHRETTTGDKWV